MLQWVIFVAIVVTLTVFAIRVSNRLRDQYPLDPDEASAEEIEKEKGT